MTAYKTCAILSVVAAMESKKVTGITGLTLREHSRNQKELTKMARSSRVALIIEILRFIAQILYYLAYDRKPEAKASIDVLNNLIEDLRDLND